MHESSYEILKDRTEPKIKSITRRIAKAVKKGDAFIVVAVRRKQMAVLRDQLRELGYNTESSWDGLMTLPFPLGFFFASIKIWGWTKHMPCGFYDDNV